MRKPFIGALAALAVISVACSGGSPDDPGRTSASTTPGAIAPEATGAGETAGVGGAETSLPETSLPGTAGTGSTAGTSTRPQNADGRPARVKPTFKITGIDNWLNGDPTTIAEEAALDNVVLIDFWTYTCINCLRTIPRLRAWQEKYGDRGLKIIGIHSPEFEFETRTENVRDAMDRLGVTWLVAQDNEMATWRAFDNRVWPAKYLFSAGGLQIYQHFGEGAYAVTETRIRQALTSAGHDISDIPFDRLQDDVRDPFAPTETREIYAGYGASYQTLGLFNGHPDFYTAPDQIQEYTDPGDGFRVDGRYYLNGLWENRIQSIVHARQTENLEDYIALSFNARSVNVVINPTGQEAAKNPVPGVLLEVFDVVIELNDRPLTPEQAGADIVFNSRGQSIIQVRESRLYALLELSEYTSGNLKMRSNSSNFAVFAWTFGTYLDGA